MKKNKKKGFTLLELVVVIGIIALLAALAIPQYQSAKLSAIAATHNSNVRTMKSAAVLYLNENGDETGDLVNGVKNYLDGKELPKVAKEIDASETWEIKSENGAIVIKPGEVEIKDGKIVTKVAGK